MGGFFDPNKSLEHVIAIYKFNVLYAIIPSEAYNTC